jgi:hypothetical protein
LIIAYTIIFDFTGATVKAGAEGRGPEPHLIYIYIYILIIGVIKRGGGFLF